MTEKDNVDKWIDEFSTNEITAEDLACLVRLIDRDVIIRMDCRLDHELERYLFDAGAIDLISKLNVVVEKNRRGRKRSQLFLMAAALLVLVFSGVAFWYIRNGMGLKPMKYIATRESVFRQENQNAGFAIDSLKETETDKQGFPGNEIAHNYMPNPDLESLVGLNMRAYRFRLVSPQVRTEVKVGEKLNFRWMNGGEMDKMEMEVFDRDGGVVFITAVTDSNGWILPTVGWKSGRYYWKLLQDGNLVKAGVFDLR